MEVVGRPLGTERSPNTPSPRAAGARTFELGREGQGRRVADAPARTDEPRAPVEGSGAARAEDRAETDPQHTGRVRGESSDDAEPESTALVAEPDAGGEPAASAEPVPGPQPPSPTAHVALPHTSTVSGSTLPLQEPSTPADTPQPALADPAPIAAIEGEPASAARALTGPPQADEAGAPSAPAAAEARPLEHASNARSEAAPEPARAAAPAPAPARPSAEAQARAADILQQVKVGIVPELRQATIRLAPRELGRISIDLTLEQGRARATLRAERPETLEALTRHVPELRAAFEQRGIEPGDIRLELFERHATDGRARDPENEHGRHDGRRGSSRSPTAELDVSRAALARTLSDEAVDLYA